MNRKERKGHYIDLSMLQYVKFVFGYIYTTDGDLLDSRLLI